ncbi:hypothetical protein CAPTEDRAFT_223151 [Capitella teleta]|uniref:C2H2-type domain-containing protein n=1 Tax=Capitella teleta TaxID=283909 RepID=R7V2Y2_CAPTE|nr:hypothetical protein CAPTEDRAFT_223151 [Capitella teleta]|eukprot:ELU12929.1 hypothetical protein CAPTEDRAFT_223151 [Capitella teleta]
MEEEDSVDAVDDSNSSGLNIYKESRLPEDGSMPLYVIRSNDESEDKNGGEDQHISLLVVSTLPNNSSNITDLNYVLRNVQFSLSEGESSEIVSAETVETPPTREDPCLAEPAPKKCEFASAYWIKLSTVCIILARRMSQTVVCEVCPYEACSQVFDSISALNVHARRQHQRGSKCTPLTCTHEGCEREFTWPTHLKYHMLSHNQERAFKCDEPGCGKAFITPQRLLVHQRTHTGEKPFKCEEPGCDKAFTTKGNLGNHVRLHSGERPFRCEQCDWAFAEKSSLKKHLVKHSGKKPFSCDFCSQEFTQSSSRTAHLKRCHPEKMADKKKRQQNKLPSDSGMKLNTVISMESNTPCNELVLQAFVRDGISMYGEPQQSSPTEEEQSLCSFQGIEETSQVEQDYLKLDQCILGSNDDAMTAASSDVPSGDDNVVVLSQASSMGTLSKMYHAADHENDVLCNPSSYEDRNRGVYDATDLLDS